MRRFFFVLALISLVFVAPLSSFAATAQSKTTVKKQAVKKPVKKAPVKKKSAVKKQVKSGKAGSGSAGKTLKKRTTKASSAKKTAAVALKVQGYLTEKNGATFTLSTDKGLYSIQTDAKTKFSDESGKPTELKVILIPHILEVSGTTSGKGKLYANGVQIVAFKRGQGQLIGKVMIGPICPVQTEDKKQCADQPYRALFTILEGGKEVAKTGSNEKGYFVLSLPEGDYTLHPEKPNDSMYPKADDQTITVKAGTFTLATVKYDSGIR